MELAGSTWSEKLPDAADDDLDAALNDDDADDDDDYAFELEEPEWKTVG